MISCVRRPCFRGIWQSIITPKHSSILCLATLETLPTKDRLGFLGIEQGCLLCQCELETHNYLFFQCTLVREVWDEVHNWLGINSHIYTIKSGLKWMKKEVKGTSWLSRARRVAFAYTVYSIWCSRNKIFKKNAKITSSMMISEIKIHVYTALVAKFPEFE